VYAATPSLAAWRLLLALASHKMQTVPDFVAVIGDITRAFPHADIDTLVVTVVPEEMKHISVTTTDGKVIQLVPGMPLLVKRAQYGYRKAPQLWQIWLGDNLKELTLTQSMVEPTIFFSVMMWVILHVDDLMFFGSAQVVDPLLESLGNRMKIRIVHRFTKAGDQGCFLNRLVIRTENGFRVCGDAKVVERLIAKEEVQNAKFISTAAVRYPAKQLQDAKVLEVAEAIDFREYNIFMISQSEVPEEQE